MMNVLEINNLEKHFGGNQVVKNLTMSVKEGEVFGFIGENGAGKTTTMKIILGLLRADNGQVSICGQPVKYGETATNKLVGYLPDVPEFYGYMRTREYLNLCGEVAGLPKEKIKLRSEELLELVGLKEVKKKIGGFSRGMKQRLGIAQAMLGEPKLLICDEPTSALDPAGRKEILDIMSSVKEKTTVIFSTHVLSDVERICDTVAILHQGEIALSGSLSEVKKNHKHDLLNVEFNKEGDAAKFGEVLYRAGLEPAVDKQVVSLRTIDIEGTEAAVINLLSESHLLPTRLEVVAPTLENLFMEVIK